MDDNKVEVRKSLVRVFRRVIGKPIKTAYVYSPETLDIAACSCLYAKWIKLPAYEDLYDTIKCKVDRVDPFKVRPQIRRHQCPYCIMNCQVDTCKCCDGCSYGFMMRQADGKIIESFLTAEGMADGIIRISMCPFYVINIYSLGEPVDSKTFSWSNELLLHQVFGSDGSKVILVNKMIRVI